jgi:hypothetical protein
MVDPAKLDQLRLTELASLKKKAIQSGQKSVNAEQIQKALPDDLKPKGAAKLPLLLFGLSSQIPQIIEPSLQNLIQKYIPDVNTCPSPAILQELLAQRDDIVQSLNKIGIKIDQTGKSLTGASDFLNLSLGLINTIDIASIAISAALKIPPVSTLPIPGAIPSALNDAQTFIRKTTFDNKGISKLAKIQGTLSSASLVISLTGQYVLKAKETLTIIDSYIKKCNKDANLEPISKIINDIANSQLQADQTQNQTTYNGFIIEIEEVPYTPTVTRRRAIGKDSSGIVLIQTELSFTTDSQTLINELKFIIDRDNLLTDSSPNPLAPAPASATTIPVSVPTTEVQAETSTPTTPTSTPTQDLFPFGYAGKKVGDKERKRIKKKGRDTVEVYEWDGNRWVLIKTRGN